MEAGGSSEGTAIVLEASDLLAGFSGFRLILKMGDPEDKTMRARGNGARGMALAASAGRHLRRSAATVCSSIIFNPGPRMSES